MKLIAESQHDDQIISNLVNLLSDIGVPADGYRQEESFGLMLWSVYELDLEADTLTYMSKEDKIAFFRSIEPAMQANMRKAGLQTISKAISKAQGGRIHINARALHQ